MRKMSLHDNTVTFILLVDGRTRDSRLLHLRATTLEIFEAFTSFGEVLS